MKKIISIFLCVIMLANIIIQPAYAYSLDINYYINNKKDDGYPSNNGKWNINYIDTAYKYGVITKEEINKYSKKTEKATLYDIIDLLTRLKYIDETGKDINNMKENSNYAYLNIGTKYISSYFKNININKAVFCRYLSVYLDNSNNIKINSVELKDIVDVTEKTVCNKEIVNVIEYGIIGLDPNNKFEPYKKITNNDLMQAIAKLINPYYRDSLSLYNGDNIVVQSNEFPMYYKNYNEGLYIEITNKRYYETDCFIAHITMSNPCHIKSIYSNLNYSNYGSEIHYINDRLDPILIVNGDFRSPYIVRDKDLGIVRNCKIVRDMKFSNVLGMKKDGNLITVKETNAQAVLNLDVRDTWTFGPWLVKDGKAVEGLDDKSNHPRTFFGQVYRDDGVLEYYLIVAEGRSSTDAGLSNYEMGQILEECGVDIGYNLDGGGSSVMMFDDKLISKPSGGYFRADIDYIYIK